MKGNNLDISREIMFNRINYKWVIYAKDSLRYWVTLSTSVVLSEIIMNIEQSKLLVIP